MTVMKELSNKTNTLRRGRVCLPSASITATVCLIVFLLLLLVSYPTKSFALDGAHGVGEANGVSLLMPAWDKPEEANECLQGHWIYEEVDDSLAPLEALQQAGPGENLAATAAALAGCASARRNVGPSDGNRKRKPPNEGSEGSWRLYNEVSSFVPNDGLTTDCTTSVAIAVRWSGLDDDYPCKDTVKQYRYLRDSPKWERIGGKGAYWARGTGKADAGIELKPGDILVGRTCEETGTGSHVMIYVGSEIGELKYPGSGLTMFESHKGKAWTMMTPAIVKGYKNGFCVYRRVNDGIDIGQSRWASFRAEVKARLCPLYQQRIGSVRLEKKAYVYEPYHIAYEGLPLGASVAGARQFTVKDGEVALNAPLLPAGYRFMGWHLGGALGPALRQLPADTSRDVCLFAAITCCYSTTLLREPTSTQGIFSGFFPA